MFTVEEITGSSRHFVVELLGKDKLRHAFAYYDLKYDPAHTDMFAAFEDNALKGYLLIYHGTEVLSVVLECEEDAADKLIEHAPRDKFILHTSPSILPAARRRYPEAEHYVESWMVVERGHAKFFHSRLVRRLEVSDARELASLLSEREDRPTGALQQYESMIGHMPLCGVFVDGSLVSYAASFIQMPELWMIGGVYTHPGWRNRGYATLATSAITEEALKSAEKAVLFVRADNHPAVRAYEKIGYRKIGEKIWVDVGLGRRP